MSGTSVYTSPAPANNAGSKSSSGDGAAVVGTLLAGAVMIPIGCAAVCAIGLAKGIGALTKLGIKAYKHHQEVKKENEKQQQKLLKSAQTMVQEIQTVNKSMGIPQHTISPQALALLNEQKHQLTAQSMLLDQFTEQHISAFSAMEQKLLDSVSGAAAQYDLPRYLSEHTQAIFKNWQNDFSTLRHTYSDRIVQNLNAGEALIAKYKSMLKDAEMLRADRAKYQAVMQKTALQAISDAETLLEHLAGMPGATVFYASDLALYRNAYTNAAQAYASENYEIAFSRANDLLVQVQETMQDLLQKSFYSEMEKNRLLARAALLDEALRGMTDLHYQKDGKTYAVDLTGFMPDGFAAANKQLRALIALLACDTPMTPQELERARQSLSELETGISSVETTSRRRLESVEQSLRFCADVMPALKEQNFTFGGSAFEDDRTLHANFHNRESGVTVTLLIRHEKNSLNFKMEYYGKDGKADPNAQNALMDAIRQQTGICMSCQHPGTSSRHYSASDLAKIRKDCKFPVPMLRQVN